jgi:MFS family permease
MTCALAVGLAAFAWGVIEPLLPSRLSGYGAKPELIGLIFTASSIIYGLCAPLVGWTCERLSVRSVIVLGAIGTAATLPLLACFRGVLLIGLTLCLVNATFAFLLNPASAELGNEVDRSGVASYSVVYAVYNIVYSIGMLATSALTSAAAYSLGFFRVLLCASAVLLVSTPLLMLANSRTKASVVASTALTADPDIQK